jgi:hypothetical protein
MDDVHFGHHLSKTSDGTVQLAAAVSLLQKLVAQGGTPCAIDHVLIVQVGKERSAVLVIDRSRSRSRNGRSSRSISKRANLGLFVGIGAQQMRFPHVSTQSTIPTLISRKDGARALQEGPIIAAAVFGLQGFRFNISISATLAFLGRRR